MVKNNKKEQKIIIQNDYFLNSRSPMKKNILKNCTYANSCRECSTFTIDEHIDTAASISWTETCNKTYDYIPKTTVKIEITNKTLSFNQTRCCEGQRTLFFTGISLDRPLPTGMYLISTAKFIIIGPLENGMSQYSYEKFIF